MVVSAGISSERASATPLLPVSADVIVIGMSDSPDVAPMILLPKQATHTVRSAISHSCTGRSQLQVITYSFCTSFGKSIVISDDTATSSLPASVTGTLASVVSAGVRGLR